MDPVVKNALRLSALGFLYLLASPVYLVLGVLQWRRVARGLAIVRRGVLACQHCGHSNPLNVLSTCRRCGVTEFGSRLYCSNCRQVTRWFDCARCNATLKVF